MNFSELDILIEKYELAIKETEKNKDMKLHSLLTIALLQLKNEFGVKL